MRTSRLPWVLRSVFLVCLGLLFLVASVRTQDPSTGVPTQAWGRVRILDLNSMPWTSPPGRPAGWKFKNIHTIPSTGGGAELVFIPPNWSTKSPRHYDKESGWYFFLAGETAVVYYKNPQDQTGTVHLPKAGYLFYGVEGAIHGFDERTLVPEGCILLSWHDKRPTIEPVPFDSKETSFRGGPWPYPKVIDTRNLEWEKAAEGFLVKKLYELEGASVEIRYYAPGWKSSGPKQYADHDRWIYVMEGSVNVRAHEWPGDLHGKALRATASQVVEVPAHAIFGGGDTLEAGDAGAWVLLWREQRGRVSTLESVQPS